MESVLTKPRVKLKQRIDALVRLALQTTEAWEIIYIRDADDEFVARCGSVFIRLTNQDGTAMWEVETSDFVLYGVADSWQADLAATFRKRSREIQDAAEEKRLGGMMDKVRDLLAEEPKGSEPPPPDFVLFHSGDDLWTIFEGKYMGPYAYSASTKEAALEWIGDRTWEYYEP
jgi:hypothetical protein